MFLSVTVADGLWCGLALTPHGHWILPSHDTAGGELKAVDPFLNEVWTFDMSDWSDGGAAIAPDGTIFVGDSAGNVYSLTEEDETDGMWSVRENWSVNLGAPVNSRLKLGADGKVYAIAGRTTLCALDPADGSIEWSQPVGGGDSWQVTTALSPDGSTVYFRTKGGEGLLYAFAAEDGALVWARHVAGGDATASIPWSGATAPSTRERRTSDRRLSRRRRQGQTAYRSLVETRFPALPGR